MLRNIKSNYFSKSMRILLHSSFLLILLTSCLKFSSDDKRSGSSGEVKKSNGVYSGTIDLNVRKQLAVSEILGGVEDFTSVEIKAGSDQVVVLSKEEILELTSIPVLNVKNYEVTIRSGENIVSKNVIR